MKKVALCLLFLLMTYSANAAYMGMFGYISTYEDPESLKRLSLLVCDKNNTQVRRIKVVPDEYILDGFSAHIIYFRIDPGFTDHIRKKYKDHNYTFDQYNLTGKDYIGLFSYGKATCDFASEANVPTLYEFGYMEIKYRPKVTIDSIF